VASTKTITSANSQLAISIDGLYNSAVGILGYASDNAFQNEATTIAETSMGVDGIMSAGYVFKEVKQKITLQADSPSKVIFDQWNDLMTSTREVVFANATLFLPATGEQYTFTRGVLTTYHGAPSAKKILQPVEYEITWEKIQKASL
jgi:hypothetical protein